MCDTNRCAPQRTNAARLAITSCPTPHRGVIAPRPSPQCAARTTLPAHHRPYNAAVNFLAHLYLAEDTPASRIGNVLPDLVRHSSKAGKCPIEGRVGHQQRQEMEAGAVMHRRVDAFTDTHPLFSRSRARLRPRHGIFSGVLVDVIYDHVLADDWQRYHPKALSRFVADVHRDFEQHADLMPSAMRPAIAMMIEQNWLLSYATLDGVELTLRRMSERFRRRFHRPVHLETAVDDLRRDRASFAGDFHAFFPQLIRHVRRGGVGLRETSSAETTVTGAGAA